MDDYEVIIDKLLFPCQDSAKLTAFEKTSSNRIRTGHGKPGMLESYGILQYNFPGLESHGI